MAILFSLIMFRFLNLSRGSYHTMGHIVNYYKYRSNQFVFHICKNNTSAISVVSLVRR